MEKIKLIDVLDFITKTKLKKIGRNYVMRCSFHDEITPSFVIMAHKDLYHCFGCSKTGPLNEIEFNV